MNRLYTLPRGFGSFPALEVLDLTYNNITEKGLPGNFFFIEPLRALYLGDNDMEILPGDVKNLKNIQILVLRDNNLISLPRELAECVRLRELHIQGNRLTLLPPEIGELDLVGNKQVMRMFDNPWVAPIAQQLELGTSHVMEYIKTDTYKFLFGRQEAGGAPIPPINPAREKKTCRGHKTPGC